MNIQITQVTFAVGDNDWTATYDGRQLTLESGSLELSIDWNEDDNEEGWLYSLTSDDLAALPRMAEDMFWIAKAAKKGATP